jgi:hypothetical protein
VLAQNRWRKGARGADRQIGVEGKGRVFTRKLGKAHSKARRHEGFARAVDLELPLLRYRQHEIATRSAVAAPIEAQAQVSRR